MDMERILVGHIMVDSGTVMIGDPCYTLPDDGSSRDEVIRDWQKTCDVILSKELPVDFGEGIAIFSDTGYGDGTYPVYAYRKHGRTMKLEIDFEGTENDEDSDA